MPLNADFLGFSQALELSWLAPTPEVSELGPNPVP